MPIGEAVLSAFMQALFDKVIAAAIGELKFPPDVKEELQNLSSSLSIIQAHVEDAEEQQMKDKTAHRWLAKLKEVAYEMDDLLDEYAAEALQSKLEGPSNHDHLKKVRSCFCCFWLDNCLFNHKIVQQIRRIEQKLDRLVKERQIFGSIMMSGTERQEIKERPKTSSLIDDSSVFGREEDKETIVKMLLAPNNSNYANLPILPIVGMGGLGKTTLTQLVYNDARIKDHFHLRVWLYVSENFDEMKLTKETIESVASGFSSATTNMNLLQEDLSKKLQGKRFLLVLDDVWNEDPEKWDRVTLGKQHHSLFTSSMLASICRRRLATPLRQILAGGGGAGTNPFRSSPEAALLLPHGYYSTTVAAASAEPKPWPAAARNVRIRDTDRANAVAALLRECGFSEAQVTRTLRYEPLLTLDPDRIIRPKLDFFSSLGFVSGVKACGQRQLRYGE
nr:unnamed protein product [Digitaria exilis]